MNKRVISIVMVTCVCVSQQLAISQSTGFSCEFFFTITHSTSCYGNTLFFIYWNFFGYFFDGRFFVAIFQNIYRFSGWAVFLSKHISHYLKLINNLLILSFLSLSNHFGWQKNIGFRMNLYKQFLI